MSLINSNTRCLLVLIVLSGSSSQAPAQLMLAQPVSSPPTSSGLSNLDRVNYALELAQLGAEHNMQELSLTAVRRALGNGPPFEVELSNPGFSFLTTGVPSTSSSTAGFDAVQRTVEERLRNLSDVWKRQEFPAADVYGTLVAVVFPESRPDEVFLYTRPVLMQPENNVVVYTQLTAPLTPSEVRSVGQLLVEWSLRARRQDDLRTRIAALAQSPRAQLQAEVLTGWLAIAERDFEAANQSLARLNTQLQQNSSTHAAEQACCLALPALEYADTRAAALPLVDQLVTNVTPTMSNEGSNVQVLAELTRMAARMHYALGNADEGRRMLEKFLTVHEVNNQRYGGDYPLFLRKSQLGVVAFELLRAGDVDAGLKRLTERANISTSNDYGTLSDAGLGGLLARRLAALPADQRYQVLLQFTLPQGNSQSLRLVQEFVPRDAPPAAFYGDGSAAMAPTYGIGEDLFSTVCLLIDTAEELGRLDELIATLQPLADAGGDGAREFVALAELRAGQSQHAQQELSRLTTELQQLVDQNNRPPYPMLAHLFISETAKDPALARQSANALDRLIRLTKQSYNDPVRSHARWAQGLAIAAQSRGTSPDLFETALPAAWVPAAFETAAEHSAGSAPNIWFAQERMINHLCGPHDANLFFRYPLTGAFEFSAEIQSGDWGEGVLSFGGVTFNMRGHQHDILLHGDGRHGSTPSFPAPYSHAGRFNRHTIQVAEGKLKLLVNGLPLIEDEAGDNPWLALSADWGRNPIFRNLQLTGAPQIPREVRLSDDPRLRGWIAAFYGQTRSDPLIGVSTAGGQPVVQSADANGLLPSVAGLVGPSGSSTSAQLDWSFSDGTIIGRRNATAPVGLAQSRLYYHRPLLDGERIRYEFLYEPGQTGVHPTVGRIAFLLEPEGVALHWMTDGDVDATGLAPDNRITVAAEQRGPVPLTPDEWNQVELSRNGGVLAVTVNSVVVYEHVLDEFNDGLFGLFHDRTQTEARARNVVLSGDWPETVPEEWLADLTAPSDPDRSTADSRTIGNIINERHAAENAYHIYQHAVELPVEERYAFLREWVLPGRTHTLLRMYGATTPTHPIPVAIDDNPVDAAQLEAALAVRSRRIEVGGNLVSPAQELVSAAAELGRLDELSAEVEAAPLYAQFHARARLALLAMIRIAQGRAAEARPYFIELYALTQAIESYTQHFRWADVIAARMGVEHEETRDLAIELMHLIVTAQLQNGQPGDGAFDSQVRRIRSLGWLLREGVAPGEIGDAGLDQWTAVGLTQAGQRGDGFAPSHWLGAPGQLRHMQGHETDCAYFAVPLLGNYEVRAQLASFGWRETRVAVAGLWTGLLYTRNVYDLGFARSRRAQQSIEPVIENVGAWYDYRVEVRDGVSTSYVNGRQLHQERLPATPDPWISAITNSNTFGGVRQLQITGEPQVPDEINLLSLPDLSNWVYDYFGQSGAGDNPDWRIEGGVLIGRHKPEWAGMHAQSVIQYHRPLLEDGEVSYEFLYAPGRILAHPALDRLVLLITPEGIREHWLTDIHYDRTGIAADNAVDVPEHRRGPSVLPLKPEEWNQAVLAVSGDTLSLTLNGELVYERAIEPTNLRGFALFHYADQTELRVRNIRHRGDWPKSLPAVAEQELAPNPLDVEQDRQIQIAADFDFTQSNLDELGLSYQADFRERFYSSSENGLAVRFTPGEQKPTAVFVGPKFGLRGDFDIVADFAGLNITAPAEHWGAGIELNVDFHDDYNSRIQYERRHTKEGNQNLGGAYFSKHCDGAGLYRKETYNLAPADGRLRVSRRGGWLYYALAGPGSDEFQILSEEWVGTHDVRSCSIRAVSSDAVGGVEVDWKSLAVTAEEIIPSPAWPASTFASWAPDLSAEPIGGPIFRTREPGAEQFTFRTADGLHMHTPRNQEPVFGASLTTTNIRLEGDFEVTADFELARLTPPESGFGAGIQLQLELDNPDERRLHLCRRAFPDTPAGFAVHDVRQVDGQRVDEGRLVPSDAMAGRLRIARAGTLVTWSWAATGSDEFDELYSAEVGNAPVKGIVLVCESSHPGSGAVEVLWKSLAVRGTIRK